MSAPNSRAVVKRGARGVSDRGKYASEKAVVPASTLRALQLRNGKGGSFGTGDVVRIPGREKLELIAGDEMERARDDRRRNLYEANMNSSLKAPFQLETALRIAQSQMDAYVDFIDALHNPDLCCDMISRDIKVQCPLKNGLRDLDYMRTPSFVAEHFGICVHNAYMLASGWVVLYESLRKIQGMGLRDRDVAMQLRSDTMIRDVYLSSYRLLGKIVFSLQQRLRSIVRNTPHYSFYFKSRNEGGYYQEFERSEIKRMYMSFFDSAIIELCLPGSKFSPQALYFCLHTTQEESPKLLKRCPQLMWDAIGDLAEAVRLLDIMETPLINRDFDLKAEEGSTPFNEFSRWNEAQAVSIKSFMQYSSLVDLVYPLTNLESKSTLDKAWDSLNANYVRESGQNIDALWQLVDARHRIPHFSTLAISADLLYGDSEHQNKALVRHVHNGKQIRKNTGAVIDGEDSASSMPSLKAVSDSEDECQTSGPSSGDDDDPFLSSDIETDYDEYDEDQDQELKLQQRAAIERVLEDPDVIDLSNDRYAEERTKNPLLLLLGNLRGRLFSSSSVLRTDGETTTTSRPVKTSATKKPSARPSAGTKRGNEGPSTSLGEMKTIVEDAGEERDEQKGGGDRKKKKPKKKKKKRTAGEIVESRSAETPVSPTLEPPRTPSPPPHPVSVPPPSPPPSWKGKKSLQRNASINTPSLKSDPSSATGFTSTTTLPLPHEQKAESAHSYLRQINGAKTKVKTRRNRPVESPAEKKEHKNLFDRLRGNDREVAKGDTTQKDISDVFSRLRKKTVKYARRLIGVKAQDKKGALKWDQFLQVMRELGFEYDPSTAGSSVRFDPLNPKDRSITFHKPHPDPTLYQYKLKEYRAKLESHYGWSPDKFEKAVEGLGAMSGGEEDD